MKKRKYLKKPLELIVYIKSDKLTKFSMHGFGNKYFKQIYYINIIKINIKPWIKNEN